MDKLNELSNSLLKRYIKKASRNAVADGMMSGMAAVSALQGNRKISPNLEKFAKGSDKRLKGISKAVDKLHETEDKWGWTEHKDGEYVIRTNGVNINVYKNGKDVTKHHKTRFKSYIDKAVDKHEENLNELSTKTLSRYIKEVPFDLKYNTMKATKANMEMDASTDKTDKEFHRREMNRHGRKVHNREIGHQRAFDKYRMKTEGTTTMNSNRISLIKKFLAENELWKAEKSPMLNEAHRPLHQVAREIRHEWGNKINYAARPYLDAMGSMQSHKDNYGADSGHSVVAYFLSNANSYRGEKAKAHKNELKAMLKDR
jgi:hypothetical protein